MSETKTVQLIMMAGLCAFPWLLLLFKVVSARQHHRELSAIEARLLAIQTKVNATRERLNLPK